MGRGGGVNPLQELLLLMKILHFYLSSWCLFSYAGLYENIYQTISVIDGIRIAIFDSHFWDEKLQSSSQ